MDGFCRDRDEKLPLSPKQSKSPPEVASSGRVPMTPSDWGTPGPGNQTNWMPPWPGAAGLAVYQVLNQFQYSITLI